MRVDLILQGRRSYTFETYAMKQVTKALENQLPYQVIYLNDGCLRDYMAFVQHSPPMWSLSFTNPTPQGIPLCDLVHIPHFCWCEKSPAFAMPLLHSKYGQIGVPDKRLCTFAEGTKMLYFPHGVERYEREMQKTFNTIFFGDLIDTAFLEQEWKAFFSSDELSMVYEAIQKNNPLLAQHLYYYAEMYLNAVTDYQLMTSFHQTKLDVFGEHVGENWLIRLPNRANVSLHSKLPYCEHIEVLKASQTALLSQESPWYLPAIAAHCLPISTSEEASFYLSHPAKREEKLAQLQLELVHRDWNIQTQKLIEVMKCRSV